MGFCVRKCRLLRMKLKKHWMTVTWIALCMGTFYIDYMRYKLEPQFYYLRRMLGIGMCISRGTAAVLNLSCCVLIVPMCRALATNLSSAFKSFLSQCQAGTPNHRPPTLPALFSSRATQTAKSIHTLIAGTVIVSSVLHTCAHIGNAINASRYYSSNFPEINIAADKGKSPLYLFIATVPGVTGVAMVVLLSVLALTSMKWVRRRSYNTFFYTHYLGLFFFVLLIVHPLGGVLKEQKNLHEHIPGCQMHGTPVMEEGFPEPEPLDYYEVAASDSRLKEFHLAYYENTSYPEGAHQLDTEDSEGRDAGIKVYSWRKTCDEAPVFQSIRSQTWIWIIVAFMLWTADTMVRWLRQRADVRVVNVVHHPCDIVQLTLYQPGFTCTPGQYVLIQCPSVSRFEWHPFTVTFPSSTESPNTFTILMRIRGDWSSKVASLFHPSSESSQELGDNAREGDDTSSHYYPIIKESSHRRTNTSNDSSSQPSLKHVSCDHNTHGIVKSHQPPHPSKSYITDSFYLKYDEKSETCSFSPKELENRNFRLFSRAVFCTTRSCIHSDFLYSNLSLLKDYSKPLYNDCEHAGSCSSHSHENKLDNTLGLHSCNLKSNTCPVKKMYNDRMHFHKSRLQNGQRKTDTQTDLLYPEALVHSECQSKYHSHSASKRLREEKEPHTINIDTACYTRLHIDGPYSSPSEEMLHYPVIIGAAGGVGITPLAATLSHKLWHPMMWPRRIHMVWVVRDARLLLVIAPLLSSLLLHCWRTNMEDCIELRLHVTIPTSQQVLQDLFADDYPCLIPRISQGRPHWKHLFQEWRQIYTRKKVGVFTCGPPKMCRQVKRHCLQAVAMGANFNYHQESFS